MQKIKPLKTKADNLFSKYIRSTGKCERCGRDNNVQLQCAHIFSRKFVSTRYEPINALCLCSACHRWLHDKPLFGSEWIKEYLGESVYEELSQMSKTKIVKSNELFYKEIIRKLKEGEAPYEA